eukprot:TRINITY_DN9968_c0_g1_i3.p1 TRINITY_DN9968_c0_g1~~TRINITY_DN9968_c0_g1_i3.p1  ORF type:complete len:681 (+),score=95.31 TRINITY_DN9968_c0_g1_i3:49-2091(+)
MSKKTFEICFDVEGLRLIPIGEDQVSVQILSEDADQNMLPGEGEVVSGILEEHDPDSIFLSQQQAILETEEDSESASASVQSSNKQAHSTDDLVAPSVHSTSISPSKSVAVKSSSRGLDERERSEVVQNIPHQQSSSVPGQIQHIQLERFPQQIFPHNSQDNNLTNKIEPTNNTPTSLIRLAAPSHSPHAQNQQSAKIWRENPVQQHNVTRQLTSPKISRQNLSVSDGQKTEELPPSIRLYIEYGNTWMDDLLLGMSAHWKTTCDFPVYCCDGIAWTSAVILGSFNLHLRNLLLDSDEDSCIILPQITKREFDTFMELILKKEYTFDKDTADILEKVGQILDFPNRQNQNNTPTEFVNMMEVDYQNIFTHQKEEFIHRISRQSDLAQQICDNTFERDSSQNNRKLFDREDRNNFTQEPDSIDVIQGDEDQIQGLECGACDRILPSEEAMQVHRSIVHSSTSNAVVKQYSCFQCDKVFSFKSSLSKHNFLMHRGSNRTFDQFFDDSNAEMFGSNSSERVQKSPRDSNTTKSLPEKTKRRSKEVNNESVVCKVCGVTCKNRRALVAHNQKHYGRLFECTVKDCGKRFTESSKLRRHMVVHTKEKNFECPECKKRFTLLQNLKSHVKNHHKLSAIKQKELLTQIIKSQPLPQSRKVIQNNPTETEDIEPAKEGSMKPVVAGIS